MHAELTVLRGAVDRVLTAFLWVHVPVLGFAAWAAGNAYPPFIVGGSLVAGFCTAMGLLVRNDRVARLAIGVGLMADVSLVVAAMAGHPWQADAHMYYFAMLAIVSAYCDFGVILAAAATVAVHHLAFSFLLPGLVFPGEGTLPRVFLHAAILVLETGALVWMAERVVRLLARNAAVLAATEERGVALQAAVEANVAAQAVAERQRSEIGAMAADIAQWLQTVVQGMQDAAAGLASNARSLTGAAVGAGVATRSVAAAAHVAAANAVSVVEAVDRLTASTDTIAGRIAAAAAAAADGDAQLRETTALAQHLSTEAGRIGEIVGLIDSIAAQTSMLALNATIESARAGSAGRGFAVVASEVKNLASETAEATRQIQGQLLALQSGTVRVAGAVEAMGRSIGQVTAMTGQVAEVITTQSEATAAISLSVQSTSTGMAQIERDLADMAASANDTLLSATRLTDEGGRVGDMSEAIASKTSALIAKLHAA